MESKVVRHASGTSNLHLLVACLMGREGCWSLVAEIDFSQRSYQEGLVIGNVDCRLIRGWQMLSALNLQSHNSDFYNRGEKGYGNRAEVMISSA